MSDPGSIQNVTFGNNSVTIPPGAPILELICLSGNLGAEISISIFSQSGWLHLRCMSLHSRRAVVSQHSVDFAEKIEVQAEMTSV